MKEKALQPPIHNIRGERKSSQVEIEVGVAIYYTRGGKQSNNQH